MLVLSRRLNETVVINGNVTVRVVDISRGKVRLGIIAPKDVTINRLEVQEHLAEEAQREPA